MKAIFEDRWFLSSTSGRWCYGYCFAKFSPQCTSLRLGQPFRLDWSQLVDRLQKLRQRDGQIPFCQAVNSSFKYELLERAHTSI